MSDSKIGSNASLFFVLTLILTISFAGSILASTSGLARTLAAIATVGAALWPSNTFVSGGQIVAQHREVEQTLDNPLAVKSLLVACRAVGQGGGGTR